MQSVDFKESNVNLAPPKDAMGEPKKYRSSNVKEVTDLPIWTNGEQCISCWQMSWKERLSALVYGKVWIALLSGKTQPPLFAKAANSIFDRVQNNQEG